MPASENLHNTGSRRVYSITALARASNVGRHLDVERLGGFKDDVAKGLEDLSVAAEPLRLVKQTRQSLILAVIGAIVAGAVGAFWLGFKTIFGKRSRGRWRVMRITVKPNRWPILATG